MSVILNSRMGLKKNQFVTPDDLLGKKPEKKKIQTEAEQKLEIAKIMNIFNGTTRSKKSGNKSRPVTSSDNS